MAFSRKALILISCGRWCILTLQFVFNQSYSLLDKTDNWVDCPVSVLLIRVCVVIFIAVMCLGLGGSSNLVLSCPETIVRHEVVVSGSTVTLMYYDY